MRKKILATGASGFVGGASVKALAARGWEVHAVTFRRALENQAAVRYYRCDLANRAAVANLLSDVRPDCLLHVAWEGARPDYATSSGNAEWRQIGNDLIGAFAAQGGSRAVVAGSSAEYGAQALPCDELTSERLPTTPYAVSKHGLRLDAETISRATGMALAWGHIFMPYGPGDAPHRLIPSVLRALSEDRPVECTHGNQIRDLIFIDDVARAFALLCESDATGPFNIACGVGVRIRDLVTGIANRLDRLSLVRFGAKLPPPFDPPLLVASTKRAREMLGWTPLFSLDRGIEEILEDWKKRNR